MTDLKKLLIPGILLLAFALRFYGVNWDQNQHLHPDERFLTMVTETIDWPADIPEYFDTAHSPLNPHNRGFGFFVYGTFPVFFTKWIAESVNQADYSNLTLVGRQISALFDLGTVVMVFFISSAMAIKKRYGKKKDYLPVIAMFIYSLYVLPIQLSHFYAVDSFLVFFLTVTFFLNQKIMEKENNYRKAVLYFLTGLSFGLALTSKISAVLILPALVTGQLITLYKNRKFLPWFASNLIFIIVSLLTVRIFQPYAFKGPSLFDFSLNAAVLENWKQLKNLGTPESTFPPAIQWIKTKAFLYPLKNLLFWGTGLPLGLIAVTGSIFSLLILIKTAIGRLKIFGWKKGYFRMGQSEISIMMLIIWISSIFTYEGMQFAKNMRYFYPIYPAIAIISAFFIHHLLMKLKEKLNHLTYRFVLVIGILTALIYPYSFMSIYSQPHPRIAASTWIYKNIPADSVISGEHWDDYIPLSLPVNGYIREKYKGIEFPLYDPDSREKWILMEDKLIETDYIILTSNRLYGAIMTVPERYPVTFRYYQLLFNGNLGFEKIAEFTSRPNISLPLLNLCLTPPFANYGWIALKDQKCPLSGISFVDDYADESFTVYDHPKVLIFKKVKQVDYLEVLGT